MNSPTVAKDLNFKSAGQVEEATPFIGKISAADAASDTKPSAFSWTYTNTGADYSGSAKAIRIDSSDNIYAVVGKKAAAIKLRRSGTEVWKTGQLDAKAQMNDIELATDGLVLVGQKYSKQSEGCTTNTCSVIKGHMIKLDSTGTKQWTKDYGNYAGGKH